MKKNCDLPSPGVMDRYPSGQVCYISFNLAPDSMISTKRASLMGRPWSRILTMVLGVIRQY
jgi:hypothetical protein